MNYEVRAALLCPRKLCEEERLVKTRLASTEHRALVGLPTSALLSPPSSSSSPSTLR